MLAGVNLFNVMFKKLKSNLMSCGNCLNFRPIGVGAKIGACMLSSVERYYGKDCHDCRSFESEVVQDVAWEVCYA